LRVGEHKDLLGFFFFLVFFFFLTSFWNLLLSSPTSFFFFQKSQKSKPRTQEIQEPQSNGVNHYVLVCNERMNEPIRTLPCLHSGCLNCLETCSLRSLQDNLDGIALVSFISLSFFYYYLKLVLQPPVGKSSVPSAMVLSSFQRGGLRISPPTTSLLGW